MDKQTTVNKTVRKGHRRFKCPNCGGEFDTWNREPGRNDSCPFCGIGKGRYEPDQGSVENS